MVIIWSEVLVPAPDFLNTYLLALVELGGRDVEGERDLRPGLVAGRRIASRISSSASSFDFTFGAKPPSSPTAVE